MHLLQSRLLWIALIIAPGYVYSLPVQLPDGVNKVTADLEDLDLNIENGVQQWEDVSKHTGEESGLFEGDIILLPSQDPHNIFKLNYKDQDRSKRSMMESSGDDSESLVSEPVDESLWPGGVVYYIFDGSLNPMYRTIFFTAMDKWTNATNSCITFEPAEEHNKDCIVFIQDEKNGEDDDRHGCYSHVGRIGGRQEVSMSSECLSVGHAAHEIGHAIGLWHEHSRSDRGQFIDILFDNILDTKEQNFGINIKISTDIKYDIGSLMHYGPYSFAKPQQGRDLPTVRVRENAPWESCDDPAEMGQRKEISNKDSLRVQLLYNCGEVSKMTRPIGCAPTPTPTTTTTSSVVASPTPTITTKKLRTNDIITLQMGAGGYGVKCVPSPGCTPTPCTINPFATHSSGCSQVENQFKIVNPLKSKISSGDVIALRSVHKPSTWLNCSGQTSRCTISQCTSNAADPSNSSYITDCEEHFFIIKGIKRRDGQVLSTKHEIQIKNVNDESYLNCLGKRCQMLDNGTCPSRVPTSRSIFIERTEGNCTPQSFNVSVLS